MRLHHLLPLLFLSLASACSLYDQSSGETADSRKSDSSSEEEDDCSSSSFKNEPEESMEDIRNEIENFLERDGIKRPSRCSTIGNIFERLLHRLLEKDVIRAVDSSSEESPELVPDVERDEDQYAEDIEREIDRYIRNMSEDDENFPKEKKSKLFQLLKRMVDHLRQKKVNSFVGIGNGGGSSSSEDDYDSRESDSLSSEGDYDSRESDSSSSEGDHDSHESDSLSSEGDYDSHESDSLSSEDDHDSRESDSLSSEDDYDSRERGYGEGPSTSGILDDDTAVSMEDVRYEIEVFFQETRGAWRRPRTEAKLVRLFEKVVRHLLSNGLIRFSGYGQKDDGLSREDDSSGEDSLEEMIKEIDNYIDETSSEELITRPNLKLLHLVKKALRLLSRNKGNNKGSQSPDDSSEEDDDSLWWEDDHPDSSEQGVKPQFDRLDHPDRSKQGVKPQFDRWDHPDRSKQGVKPEFDRLDHPDRSKQGVKPQFDRWDHPDRSKQGVKPEFDRWDNPGNSMEDVKSEINRYIGDLKIPGRRRKSQDKLTNLLLKFLRHIRKQNKPSRNEDLDSEEDIDTSFENDVEEYVRALPKWKPCKHTSRPHKTSREDDDEERSDEISEEDATDHQNDLLVHLLKKVLPYFKHKQAKIPHRWKKYPVGNFPKLAVNRESVKNCNDKGSCSRMNLGSITDSPVSPDTEGQPHLHPAAEEDGLKPPVDQGNPSA